MAAYIVVRMDVTDPDQYDSSYQQPSQPTDETRRVVILQFPDMDAARTFYNSPEYTAAREKRAGAAEGQFVIVEGL